MPQLCNLPTRGLFCSSLVRCCAYQPRHSRSPGLPLALWSSCGAAAAPAAAMEYPAALLLGGSMQEVVAAAAASGVASDAWPSSESFVACSSEAYMAASITPHACSNLCMWKRSRSFHP